MEIVKGRWGLVDFILSGVCGFVLLIYLVYALLNPEKF